MSVAVRADRSGGWLVDINTRLSNGTRHRERRRLSVTSKSAARRWGQDRERHLLQHGPPRRKKEVPTLKEFWPRFLEGHARANRQKPSGIAAKEVIARVHVLPSLGDHQLDTIATENVQQLKAGLAGKAPKTVNNVLTVLNTMLKKAVEWGVIDRMPCVVRLLPVPPPSARFHDFEDFERLVEGAKKRDDVAYLVVLLGGEAGLRRGEITALEWGDVEFEEASALRATVCMEGPYRNAERGRLRYVPLTQRLAAALHASRHLRGPLVFCDRQGKPLNEKIIGDHVDHAAQAAKLNHRGVHVLRHTFCSHLAMRGAPARAIQELAGHADLRTTQRYMHLTPAALDAAIRLLDAPTVVSRGHIVATGSTEIGNSVR